MNIIPDDFSAFSELAEKQRKETYKYLQRLKKKKTKQVDANFQAIHEDVFACTDCLKCANCCKTTGPLFTHRDIERIAKHLRMKSGKFVQEYLRMDEDGDYVLQEVPCAFLGEDNYCSIYDVRPKACREYPHTDSDKMQKLLNLTAKNIEICPAAFEIVERMKEAMPT
ncbi:MAG: YkgJ family cysteine cluster protein [Chitinophagales bacterium]